MAFSIVVHGIVPKDEILGVAVGHVWYFFNDVYPSLHGGHRPLDPPAWWRRIFEGRPPHPDSVRGNEDPATEPANINRDIAAAAALEVR
jgi:Derlin-2/3